MMHKNMHTRKSSQTLHCKTNKSVTGDKNTEVENEKHDAFNFVAVCQNSDKIVSLGRKNTFKQVRKNIVKKIKKLLKQSKLLLLLL